MERKRYIGQRVRGATEQTNNPKSQAIVLNI